MRGTTAIALLLALISLACATAQGNAAKVRLTSNPDAVRECNFLGNVQGSDHLWGGTAGQGIAENNATVYMKNKTNAMGGDTILLARSTTNTSGSTQLGEASDCSAQPAAPAAPTPVPHAAVACTYRNKGHGRDDRSRGQGLYFHRLRERIDPVPGAVPRRRGMHGLSDSEAGWKHGTGIGKRQGLQLPCQAVIDTRLSTPRVQPSQSGRPAGG